MLAEKFMKVFIAINGRPQKRVRYFNIKPLFMNVTKEPPCSMNKNVKNVLIY